MIFKPKLSDCYPLQVWKPFCCTGVILYNKRVSKFTTLTGFLDFVIRSNARSF